MSRDENDPAKTSKGEATRARIVEAALSLFRERGYQDTTMREVARRAEVSLGNAYYYFSSKEHLLQAFYGRIHEAHGEAVGDALRDESDLRKRLLLVLRSKLEVIEPYHRFSGLLFKHSADPKSPLSPFGESSKAVRDQAVAMFADVVEGTDTKIPADVRSRLPRLLWLYSMGIVLYWIHDESDGRERTNRLIDRSADLVARVIGLLSHPLLRPLRRSALRLIDDVSPP